MSFVVSNGPKGRKIETENQLPNKPNCKGPSKSLNRLSERFGGRKKSSRRNYEEATYSIRMLIRPLISFLLFHFSFSHFFGLNQEEKNLLISTVFLSERCKIKHKLFCGFFNLIFHLIGFSAFPQNDVQLSLSFAVNLECKN